MARVCHRTLDEALGSAHSRVATYGRHRLETIELVRTGRSIWKL